MSEREEGKRITIILQIEAEVPGDLTVSKLRESLGREMGIAFTDSFGLRWPKGATLGELRKRVEKEEIKDEDVVVLFPQLPEEIILDS